MINFSYGHISKEYLDTDYIKMMLKKGIDDIDFSNYSIPGGNIVLREKMAREFGNNLSFDKCCTSVSTNLSFYILSKIIGGKTGFVYPIYSNFFKQLMDEDSDHQFSIDDFIENKIDYSEISNGKIVIVYPNNPTGVVFSISILKSNLIEMKKYNVSCILDISWINSIYEESNFVSIKDISNLVSEYKLIILLGFTKLFAVPSIRCSGIIADNNIVDKFIKHHDVLALSCGQIDEYLVSCFIDKTPVMWPKLRSDLKEKSKFIESKIIESGLSLDYRLPASGIFFYVNTVDDLNLNELVSECCKKGLLIYPSDNFEKNKKGFRIAFCQDYNILDSGIDILLDVLNSIYK